MGKRISYLDVLKGIGILLVVFGHSGGTHAYFYSFHMPLFFFISGYLFSVKKGVDFTPFAVKKAKSLLVPYANFIVLSMIIMLIVDHSLEENLFSKIFMLNGEALDINTPLWYLIVLYLVEIGYYFISKINIKKTIPIILVFLSIIGYSLSLANIKLPFSIDIVLMSLVFFGFGHLIKNKLSNWINNSSIKLKISVFVASTLISVLFANFNNSIYVVSMYSRWYGNYFYFYSSALFGILAIFIFAYMINSSKILEYFGKNSLVILSVHYLVVHPMVVNWGDRFPLFNFDGFVLRLYNTGIYMIIGMAVSILSIFIINKYFPFMIGMKRKKDTFIKNDNKIKIS